MASVTGMTAERMLEIEASVVVSGAIDTSGHLILTTYNGIELDAGYVKGNAITGVIDEFAGTVPPSNALFCDGQEVSRTEYDVLFGVIGTSFGVGDGSTTFNVPNRKGRVGVGVDPAQAEFDTLGESGGSKTHTLTSAEIPSHTHTQNAHGHALTNGTVASAGHKHSLSDTAYAMIRVASVATQQIVMRRITSLAWTPTHQLSTDAGGATSYTTTEVNAASLGGETDVNATTVAVSVQTTAATNQSTGGGGSHNNLQPYLTLNYIIYI